MNLDQFPNKPGIYEMLNADGQILYVGKARDLRKRIASYFRTTGLPAKTQVLMRQVKTVHTIITASDTEAFLLEANLIKAHRPRYNVLLRDDKSYPYLYLETEQNFPRLDFYRGSRKKKGRYFGPYPTAGAVRENLGLLQKLFLVRQCSDLFFKNRSRPCLQYQIKRCTAPCVGYVTQEDYAQQVEHTILFLEGKNDQIIEQLQARMDQASERREYELAARYRDQMMQLRKLQETQCITGEEVQVDIIGVALDEQAAAVSVLFVRQGRMIGQRIYFPEVGIADTIPEILNAFILQYYLNEPERDRIDKIIVSDKFPEKKVLQELLQQHVKHKLVITDYHGAMYKPWQSMAKHNAQHGLTTYLAEKESAQEKLLSLQKALHLKEPIQRIECFDVSHTQGEATVASCVVYDVDGARNKEYRRFNIKNVAAGDDYAAMEQVLMRRYKKLKSADQLLPDLVLIDGGRGQLHKAIGVFEELQLTHVQLLAVSKGPARKPGQERLWMPGHQRALHLPPDSMALHLIQFIRDESHRFAITAHRQRRAKERSHSQLEDIPGIGGKRRRDILRYFGSIQALRDASVLEIAKVSGISHQMAQKIYDFFH